MHNDQYINKNYYYIIYSQGEPYPEESYESLESDDNFQSVVWLSKKFKY